MSARKWIEQELLPGEQILWSHSSNQLFSARAGKQFFGALCWGMFCFFCVFCSFATMVSGVLAPGLAPYVFCMLVVLLLWRSIRYIYGVVSDSLWQCDVLTNYRVIRAERNRGELCLWSLPLGAVTAESVQGKVVLHLTTPYTYMWKDAMVFASGEDATHFLDLFHATRADRPQLSVPEPLEQPHDLLPDGEKFYGAGEQLQPGEKDDPGLRRWLLFWAIWSGSVLVAGWLNPPADCTWVPWCVCGVVFVLSLTLLVLGHRAHSQYQEVWLPFVVGAENVYGKEFSPLPTPQCYPLEKVLHTDGTASFFFTEPTDYRDCGYLACVRNHAEIGHLLYRVGQMLMDISPLPRKNTPHQSHDGKEMD